MSAHIDVCNGDADGLCATVQWRLQHPVQASLITGLKRDIALLRHVQATAGDEVCVFDVSMRRNLPALLKLLDAGVQVMYADHHDPGDIPPHPLMTAHIDRASDACTSLIVDRLLIGVQRAWALVGAYGDNLGEVADQLAQASGLSPADTAALRQLGEAINHNAYGEEEADVCIAPARLFPLMLRHPDPLAFLTHEPVAREMIRTREADIQQALALQPHWQDAHAAVYLMPDQAWSRRASGSLANAMAQAEPQRAHAVLTPSRSGALVVSVRAPLARPAGADLLCGAFGGNGRARAAGIDALPQADVPRFIAAFTQHFTHHAEAARLQHITAQTIANYNAQAEAFWLGTRGHDVSQNIDALLRHIEGQAPFTILDVGCGPGRDLMAFTQQGHHAIGLEGTPAFAEMARAHSGCEVWQQSFLALDLPPAHFDGIFANASLFHVPTSELPRVLRQLHAALKPRGVLFSSNPLGHDEEGWSGGRYGVFHAPSSWRSHLQHAGFDEVVHYYRPPGLPREQQRWFAGVWRKPA